jgi:PAS domain S-box-containing protein
MPKPRACRQTTERSAAPWLLIVTILSVFIVGVIVVLFLSPMLRPSVQLEAVVGALLLTVLISPIIYLFSFRPLSRQVRERLLAEGKLRQSEEKFGSLAENSPNMIFINKMGRIVYANKRCEEIMKFTKDEFYSPDFDFLALIAPDSRYLVKENFSRHQSGEDVPPYEHALITKDGRRIEAIINTKIIEYEGENALLGVITDITERKWAEEKIRESEERHRAIWENSPIGICLTDRDGIYRYVSPRYCQMYGYSREQLINKPFYDLLMRPGDPEDRRKRYNELFENAGPLPLGETQFLNIDGELIWIQYTGNFIMQDGAPKYLVAMNVDVTDKKKAEDALRYSEARLSDAQRIAGLGYWEWEIQTQKSFWSDKMFELYKRPKNHGPLAEAWMDHVIPEDRERVLEAIGRAHSGDREYNLDHGIICMDGEMKQIHTEARVIRDAQGKPVRMVGIVLDITERKRAEEALRESEGRFRTLVESQGEGVGIIDPQGRFVFANPAAHEMFGVETGRLLGRSLKEFLDQDQFEIVRKQTAVQRSGVRSSYDLEFNRGDGEKRLMLVTATPLSEKDGKFKGVLGVFRDITEMRKMEEEMVKARKLESLGLLAGGIAHDFNNALTAILGNASMLKAGLDKQDDMYSGLDDVEQAATQAQALTQQLLTFSRGGAPVRQTASIVELVRKTADFMLSGSNVKCEYSIPNDIWTAKFDTGQIGQVIQNLIINADQAMPEGGVLKLSIGNIYMERGHSLPLDEGRYVRIAIQDRGAGIPGKYLDKIFDPFFTTKSEGNGLGLAIAYSVVKKHGGYIDVESQIGEGTTFYVYLPASDENPQLLEQTGEEPLSGTGKILVVDDEEFIRNMLTKILTGSGYTVRCAADGARAIEMYKNEKELGKPFDAVLMDLTIPGGMGGKEAVKMLRQIDPDAKVVVSSGYSNDPIMADHTRHGFSGRIAKPYRTGELNSVLSEVVNEKKLPA